jgi:hypothetical protein
VNVFSRIGNGFSNGFQNFNARLAEHPGQVAATFALNRLMPGAGTLANRLFFAPHNLNQTTQHLTGASQGMNDRRGAAIFAAPTGNALADALMNVPGGSGGVYSGQNALNSGLYNMANQFRGTSPTNSSQLINGLLPGAVPTNYDNSPQAGGNLGISPTMSGGAISSGPQMMNGNQFGYSQAGGGYGAGVWNGGGGMHSFQVSSGSLSPSNYGGIGGGGVIRGRGRENGTSKS